MLHNDELCMLIKNHKTFFETTKSCFFKLRCSNDVTEPCETHNGLKKTTLLVAFINARPALIMYGFDFFSSSPTYPSNSFKYAQRMKSHFQSFVLSTNNSLFAIVLLPHSIILVVIYSGK